MGLLVMTMEEVMRMYMDVGMIAVVMNVLVDEIDS
jgi:hypothetical protein